MRERSTTLLSRVNSKELWLGLSNHLDTKKHSQHRVPSTKMNDIKLALLGSEGAGKSGKSSSYIVYRPYILYAYMYVSFRLTKTLQHLFLPMCLLHGSHILSWKSSMCEQCVSQRNYFCPLQTLEGLCILEQIIVRSSLTYKSHLRGKLK